MSDDAIVGIDLMSHEQAVKVVYRTVRVAS